MKKPATKAESNHMARVKALNCLICKAPALIHHVRKNNEKRNHMKVLPLCDDHHRNYGEYGTAIHAGKNEWEKNHGTEEYWLEKVRIILGE